MYIFVCVNCHGYISLFMAFRAQRQTQRHRGLGFYNEAEKQLDFVQEGNVGPKQETCRLVFFGCVLRPSGRSAAIAASSFTEATKSKSTSSSGNNSGRHHVAPSSGVHQQRVRRGIQLFCPEPSEKLKTSGQDRCQNRAHSSMQPCCRRTRTRTIWRRQRLSP